MLEKVFRNGGNMQASAVQGLQENQMVTEGIEEGKVRPERKDTMHIEVVQREGKLKRKFDAMSKDGDTLELSDTGKIIGQRSEINKELINNLPKSSNLTGGNTKMSAVSLASCSEAKLKQLYAQKAITKQQYDKAMKQRAK